MTIQTSFAAIVRYKPAEVPNPDMPTHCQCCGVELDGTAKHLADCPIQQLIDELELAG